jgi:hypothetical protein
MTSSARPQERRRDRQVHALAVLGLIKSWNFRRLLHWHITRPCALEDDPIDIASRATH